MCKLKMKECIDLDTELNEFERVGKWLQYIKKGKGVDIAIAVHTQTRIIVNTGDDTILNNFYNNDWIEEVETNE